LCEGLEEVEYMLLDSCRAAYETCTESVRFKSSLAHKVSKTSHLRGLCEGLEEVEYMLLDSCRAAYETCTEICKIQVLSCAHE